MKKLNELKKNKKGFTLMEMIVVIVIIGILLAVLVPGILQWIDKAKEKQIEVNARTAYITIQGAATELYGKPGIKIADVNGWLKDAGNGDVTIGNTKITMTSVKALISNAGLTGEIEVGGTLLLEVDEDCILTGFKYIEGSKYVTCIDNVWEVGSQK